MKLRGLSALVTVLVLAALLFVSSRYLKTQNELTSNDMKSQLMLQNSSENKPKSLKDVIAKNLQSRDEMTERKDFDDSVLEKERIYTESEINEMSEEQFMGLLKDIELKLPRISDIKKLPPEALHRTPEPVMQAGRDLGLIKEILKVHESYDRVAVGLYERCAKETDRPTAVRALCLTNLVTIKKKNGQKINTAQYPAELVELTKMITDL